MLLASVSVDQKKYTAVSGPGIEISQDTIPVDSTQKEVGKSGNKAILSWKDYYSNRFVQPRPHSPLYLGDPTNISTKIQWDTIGKISITETVNTPGGVLDFRAPETMDLDR